MAERTGGGFDADRVAALGVTRRLRVELAKALELRDRQVEVGVRRMSPLSLELRQMGPQPLTGTLVKALAALLENKAAA